MDKKRKKYIAIICIILLLPYVLTVFMGGEAVFVDKESRDSAFVNVLIDGVVCSVSWDELLIGIVAKEIPTEYSEEAIKAQMVIVRTRLLLESSGTVVGIPEDNILDGNTSEEYIYEYSFYEWEDIQWKWGSEEALDVYNLLIEAVDVTEDMVIYYGNELAITPYHLLNNGMTRNGNEVLLGDYPYLVSRECPLDIAADNETTMVTISYDELAILLDVELGLVIEGLTYEDVEIVSRDEADYVLSISIDGNIIDGETFRSILSLKSSSFSTQAKEAGLQITTQGVGHGLGLSQNTAHYMGLEGKSYEEILQYFYSGTTIGKWASE